MGVSIRTREKIERFIKNNKLVYFSEVRALQRKEVGKPLTPKVTFKSLISILEDLQNEKKIIIGRIGNVKTITWLK